MHVEAELGGRMDALPVPVDLPAEVVASDDEKTGTMNAGLWRYARIRTSMYPVQFVIIRSPRFADEGSDWATPALPRLADTVSVSSQ